MNSLEPVQLCRKSLENQRHVCAFFHGPEEEYDILLPFIKEGIERGERVLHILDPELAVEHVRRLQEVGVDTAAAEGSGRLDLRSWRNVYLPDGQFDKGRMLASIEQVLKEGVASGYTRTRLVGHPDWTSPDLPRTADWVDYEMSLNQMLSNRQDVVVCMYDSAAFGPDRMADALRTHPLVIIEGVLQKNPFYVPANEYLVRLRELDAQQFRLKELESAAHIQRGLMAEEPPQLPFAVVNGQNESCLEVGGDFYTFMPVDEGIVVAVADVAGKGMSAAILASLLQGIIYEAVLSGVSLTRIVASANKFLCAHHLESKYATLVIARVQPDGVLEYINCAHVPPLLAQSNGQVMRLRDTNLPVGMFSHFDCESARAELEPGDHLIIVTDGITEAQNSDGELFGDSRLEACVAGEEPLERILQSVRTFCGDHPMDDDRTIVDLAFRGCNSSPE
jgi:hypothetical protein